MKQFEHDLDEDILLNLSLLEISVNDNDAADSILNFTHIENLKSLIDDRNDINTEYKVKRKLFGDTTIHLCDKCAFAKTNCKLINDTLFLCDINNSRSHINYFEIIT